MTKKITIDQLAGMIKTEFDNVKSEFDNVKTEFDNVKSEFGKMNSRFDKIEEEIKLRPTLNQIMSWGDEQIVPLALDMDKVKYIHQDEFDKLPPAEEISRTLVERGLKLKSALNETK